MESVFKMTLTISYRLLMFSGGSSASQSKLTAGVVRKAPSASLIIL